MSDQATLETPAHPYRRWIEDSGLSMEANTPAAPLPGVYYVMQKGNVCFSSDDLDVARAVFDTLSTVHWEGLLTSPDIKQRLDGARGLLRHDHAHARASAVMAADGSEQDQRREAQARHRAHFTSRRSR